MLVWKRHWPQPRMGAATRFGYVPPKMTLGVMSCQPGLWAGGFWVRAILCVKLTRFDGAMGRAADYAAIQYRLLNRSKGPAVQGPRVQADRARYRHAISRIVADQPNLSVIEAEVTALDVKIRQGCRCSAWL